MTDPYKVLGVSPTASDDEIKAAYRKLTQQYHPDRQQDSVMADIATEKMAEINAAYDKIMDMRRSGTGQSTGGYSSHYSSSNLYTDIRSHIEHGNYTAADEMLERNRNDSFAEWNYLKGMVCLSRGWMNDAYSYMEKAVRLDPSNREYQMAFGQLRNQRNGQMHGNPYAGSGNADNTCNTLCNICQCIMCADCLCDCI